MFKGSFFECLFLRHCICEQKPELKQKLEDVIARGYLEEMGKLLGKLTKWIHFGHGGAVGPQCTSERRGGVSGNS